VTTEQQHTDGDTAVQEGTSAAPSAKKRITRRRTTTAKSQVTTTKPKSSRKRTTEAVAGSSKASEKKPKSSRKRTTEAVADSSKASEKKPARRKRTKPTASAKNSGQPAKRLPRLLERLRSEVGPAMVSEFGYTSPMQVPRLDKVVLNIGMGESLENARAMESAIKDLSLISGQRPVTTKARKSIANFKVRQGMPVGLSVTIRGKRMYEFMDRLVSSALPRVRDFRGVSREAFDGRGNYSLGIREQVIFPEIDYNTVDRIRSFQIVIGTTASTDQEGMRLLEMLGMPFARPGESTRVA